MDKFVRLRNCIFLASPSVDHLTRSSWNQIFKFLLLVIRYLIATVKSNGTVLHVMLLLMIGKLIHVWGFQICAVVCVFVAVYNLLFIYIKNNLPPVVTGIYLDDLTIIPDISLCTHRNRPPVLKRKSRFIVTPITDEGEEIHTTNNSRVCNTFIAPPDHLKTLIQKHCNCNRCKPFYY